MELRQLRAFLAIVEMGNLTRAAQVLGMQQPPLTRLLQQLEAELGHSLMQRQARGMRPTAAGLALATQARALIEQANGVATLVRNAALGHSGRLAVGFTSSAALHPFVAKVLRDFRERFPAVQVHLEEAGTGELLDALLQQRLHAAFVRSAWPEQTLLQSRTLLSEPMVVAGPAGHELFRSRRPLALSQLQGQPLVLYRRPAGPGLHDAIVSACVASGFHPRVVQEAPRLTATLSLVAAGLGLTIIPASMRNLRTDGLSYRALSHSQGLKAPLILISRVTPDVQAQPLLAQLQGLTEEHLQAQAGK